MIKDSLISEAAQVLVYEILDLYEGVFKLGKHEKPYVGYWALLEDSEITTNGWYDVGHGLSYELAIYSLYILLKHDIKPSGREHFHSRKFKDVPFSWSDRTKSKIHVTDTITDYSRMVN